MKTVLTTSLSDVSIVDTERVFSVRLPSGRALHFAQSPLRVDPPSANDLPSPARGVVEAVTAFSELERQVIAINKDGRLTDMGRADKLRDPRARALRDFSTAYESRIIAHRRSTKQLEEDFYRLPEYTNANYMREQHILNLLLAAPKEKNSQIFAHALAGDDEEMSVAMLRAPRIFDVLWSGQVNGKSMRQLGEESWRAAVEKRDPEKASTLKLAQDLNAWGEKSFGQIASALPYRSETERTRPAG